LNIPESANRRRMDNTMVKWKITNKGNNKITELKQSYKGKVNSQQPENCENHNDPDLVQAFLKKWWVESDFKRRNNIYKTYMIKLTTRTPLKNGGELSW